MYIAALPRLIGASYATWLTGAGAQAILTRMCSCRPEESVAADGNSRKLLPAKSLSGVLANDLLSTT